MENKRENCCCYESGINDFDGTVYEFCQLKCDSEFDCNSCCHSDFEKQLTLRMRSLERENQEIKINRKIVDRLEKENEQLKNKVKGLEEELEQCKLLIDKREHNVADFAVANSRYVKDLRR